MNNSNIKISPFNNIVLLSFFPVVMIYMLLQFSGYRFPIMGIYVRVALLYSALISFKDTNKSFVLSFLIIYILYCALSIVRVLDSAVLLSGYFYDLLNYILPMFAFFIGSSNRITDDRYYNWFLYSVLFCFGLGLLFYFFSPNWYVQRVSMLSYDLLGADLYDLDQLHEKTRFSSFMYGPYPIQYFGIPALSFLLYLIYKTKNSKLKTKVYYAISFFVIVISVVLCQQRTAWGYLTILIVFYLFVSSGKKKGVWGFAILSIFILLIFSQIFTLNDSMIGSALGKRMGEMSFSDAMAGRVGQYESLWINWTKPILGHGMGSGGAIARLAGLPGASDAGYMKILYENGIVGSLLFLGVILPTLIRAIKRIKFFYIEIHIIVFFLIAMIGSNALSISLYYGIVFWYAIGRVWNNNYLKNAKLLNQ